MMEPETSSMRDRLRSATLGSAVVDSSVIVEFGSEQFEIKRPTLAQSKSIDRMSKDKDGSTDSFKACVYGIIQCVYVPGTSEKVFDVKDFDLLMGQTMAGFVGTFAKAIGSMLKQDAEDVEKNS